MAVTRTPTVWQRAQVWLGDNGEDEIGALGGIDETLKKLAECRFTAIHVKLHDGQTEENAGLPKRIRDRAKALGITMLVGGWGQNRTDAHADAEKVNGLILREGADYWIAACEFEYKGDAGTTNWNRTATFLHRFRELQPTFPFGFCSMPNEVRGGSFDWQSVRGANGRWIPECYPNEFPNAPSQWPESAQAAANEQFFKTYTHPALGLYVPNGGVNVRAQPYIDSMRAARAKYGFSYGYSVYLMHNMEEPDWPKFAAVNGKAGDAAALAWA
jgi:hypothetical protein